MRTFLIVVATATAAGWCAGCDKDFSARHIVQYDNETACSRMQLGVMSPDEKLIADKRIDLHHRFTMKDGTAIDVWVIKARPPAGQGSVGTALLLHDLGQSKAQHLGAGQKLAAMGYAVVLPDLRAHGHSGGKFVTYGALEKADIKDVMDKEIGAGVVRPIVYVFGEGLGAATAIQYAAIDNHCNGVLALSPYRDAASVGRRRIVLLTPAMNDAEFEDILSRAGELAHFNPHDASAESAATLVTCPMLLVHGLLDAGPSQAIYQAARGPKRMMTADMLNMGMGMDNWIAKELDNLAKHGVAAEPAATAATTTPAAAPKPLVAPKPAPAPAPAPTVTPKPAAAPAPASAPTTKAAPT